MLPLADYYGNTPGYDPDKMNVKADTINGEALNVPILKNSPWSYELKVKQTVSLGDSDIFICSICNIMADEVLTDETISVIDRLRQAAPVITTHETYLSLNRKDLGKWGQPKKYI
jgi:flavin reductase (DIM6/NTAB) family NADH-FMN oxidoreductase RutF